MPTPPAARARARDFHAHLGIPKAVLAERLALLVDEGVLTRVTAASGRDEYELTGKGRRLWPALWSLITWGNDNYVERQCRRTYQHVGCGGVIGSDQVCSTCTHVPDVADLVALPPRPSRDRGFGDDPVSTALRRPHRMLEPIKV